MTDGIALTQRNTELTRDMLRQAHLVTTDPAEQIAALFTAATVLIERTVGPAQAYPTLIALAAPTLASWTEQP